jgi:HAE1 family hydrophobic/amphiphilic exporter-1
MRLNEYRAAQINGAAAPGYSANQATAALEEVFAQTMPREMGFDYLGMSFQEKKAQQGVPPAAIFGFSLLFVFLILAALYESWSLPFSVLLSTPVAVFGAFAILWLRRTVLSALVPSYMVQIESDVYAQIGLVMLIGLAAKNAILIVEFAKAQREAGHSRREATLEACQLRLRPIIMTSFAFVLGVVPLMLSEGAGAEMRQTLGTAVFAGMLGVTLFGIFLTPVFFYVIQWLADRGEIESALVTESGTIHDHSSPVPAHFNGDGHHNGKPAGHDKVPGELAARNGTVDELESAILALRSSQDETTREQAVDSLARLAQKLKERLH